MTINNRVQHRVGSVSLVLCVGLLLISGCPSSTAVNWSSEQIDNNPSTKPVAVTMHDMDGDGLLDVVSLWRGSTGSSAAPGAVTIQFQNDGGTWSTTTVEASTKYANANGISVADVNGDNVPDVLVAAHDRLVYLRAGAAPRTASGWTSFDIAASISNEFDAWFDVAAAQIDGANGLDLVATLNDVGRLVWFASPANPDAAAGWTIHSIDSTTRQGADSLELVDLNGDSRVDVVCSATGDGNGEISWYEQPAAPAAGTWTKHVMTSWNGASRFALGDLNGDGLVDLAAVSPQAGRVAWFPQPSTVTSAWNGWVLADYTRLDNDEREPLDVVIADMDGNGQPDVVVANDGPACLYWYTPGTDNRLRWSEYRIAAIANLAFGLFDVADTDSDGLPEVFAPIDHTSDDSLDRIARFINPLATGG